MVIQRGKFDFNREFIFAKNCTWQGQAKGWGDPFDKFTTSRQKAQQLFENRIICYPPKGFAPPEQVTAKADDADTVAKLMADNGAALAAMGEIEIPDDWQKLHHKTKIKLARDLGGDVSTAQEADTFIALQADRAKALAKVMETQGGEVD